MRSFIVTSLVLSLTFQVGCAMTTKSVAQSQPKSKVTDGDGFLAAKRMEDSGNLEKAREMYEQLLVKQPDEPVYLHRLAVVCTRLQRYGEANSFYERAREKDPKNVGLLSDMGYAAYLRGDNAAAEQILRDAVHLKPSYKRASTNLALVVGRQGKFDESLELLRNVGSEASALTGLAYIHVLRSEYDLAEMRYRAALAIDPECKDATLGLADLPKRKSTREVAIVDTKPAQSASLEFDSEKPSAIQQTSGIKGTSDRNVKTASFVEEFNQPERPAKLVDLEDDEPSWMKQSPDSAVTTANRVTISSRQAPPRKLIETEFDDAEESVAKPAKSFDDE